MAIETKEGDQEFGVIACWDLATGREHLGELEIRFSFVDSQRVGTLHFFAALNVHQSSTLDEAWQDYLARCDAYSGSLEGVALKGLGDKGPAILGGVINTILYILNDEDVVREVHPGARPEKKSMNPVKARKFADIREPNRYHVGRDYVSVIEHWERDQASMKGEETGRGVRPHVRAAHAHLYWTGKGGQIPKVRFLAPIPVKGGHVPGDEDDPKVTKVR